MKLNTALLAAMVVALIGGTACAQTQKWEQQEEARAQKLIKKNGPGSDTALKKRLASMMAEDQGIRRREINALPKERPELLRQMDKTDAKLTAELKQIVAAHGWPTIALVGARASQGAAVILIHSPDHRWQGELLPGLQKLVQEKKIFGSDIATLTDKILVARHAPQKFGTQFNFANGKMLMEPVEDPEHLEERRALYGLPPMDLYRKMLSDMYHVKE